MTLHFSVAIVRMILPNILQIKTTFGKTDFQISDNHISGGCFKFIALSFNRNQ
jgi:hypothetical protein